MFFSSPPPVIAVMIVIGGTGASVGVGAVGRTIMILVMLVVSSDDGGYLW